MANVKISELVALTTPATADMIPIVDASEIAAEKTKYILYSDLKTALTGVGATYGTTGIYTASMPTNGVSAVAKVMLGDSGTIAWFYINAAPPGWKVVAAGGDMCLAVSGGSGYYSVSGGNADSLGSWSISGLSHSHTHTGPSHSHTITAHTHGLGGHTHSVSGTTSSAGSHSHTLAAGTQLVAGTELSLSTSTDTVAAHAHTYSATASAAAGTTDSSSGSVASGQAGTGNTSEASSTTVNATGAWRPRAYVGKLFQLDTA